jgi:hypothetical protein
MAGGKTAAKFAFDGLQLVYSAAEKQTKDYIASKEQAKKASSNTIQKKYSTAINDDENDLLIFKRATLNSIFAVTTKGRKSIDEENVIEVGKTIRNSVAESTQQSDEMAFATAATGDNDPATKISHSKSIEESSKPFFAATSGVSTTGDGSTTTIASSSKGIERKKEVITNQMKLSSNDDDRKSKPVSGFTTDDAAKSSTPFFAASDISSNNNSNTADFTVADFPVPSSKKYPSSDEPLSSISTQKSSSVTTSSLMRKGGRMFIQFVSDGLQLVQQQVTSSQEEK